MSDDEWQLGTSPADNNAELLQQAEQVDTHTNGSEPSIEDENSAIRERVDELEATVEHQQEIIEEQQETIGTLKSDLHSVLNRLEILEADVTGESGSITDLRRYSQLDNDQREKLLTTTEQRALQIVDEWEQLAWGPNDNGELYVDTKTKANAKYNPSKLKYRLSQLLDEDLEWEQIYRAMKAVAKLSGGEPEHDEYGRLTIKSKRFVYQERPTANNQDIRRVLKET